MVSTTNMKQNLTYKMAIMEPLSSQEPRPQIQVPSNFGKIILENRGCTVEFTIKVA